MEQTNLSTPASARPFSRTFSAPALFAAFLGGALLATIILVSLIASKRLNAKSDEILARFSQELDLKAADTTRRLSSYYRLQAEQFSSNSMMLSAQFAQNLNAKADEVSARVSGDLRSQADQALAPIQAELTRPAKARAARQAALLASADRFAKTSRPELAELCYLSALASGGEEAGAVLKPFLAWKEAVIAAAPQSAVLTNGPALLRDFLQNLDHGCSEAQASPAEMEDAVAGASRIKDAIVSRQMAGLKDLEAQLQWETFTPTNLETYVAVKAVLVSISPASPEIARRRSQSQELADNLMQTARALSPGSQAQLLPPSPTAPDAIQTNWFETALLFLHQPTNRIGARLAAFAVLREYATSHAELSSCQYYLPQLDSESMNLACQRWCERRTEFTKLREGKPKADAATLADGQALLNQGFELVHSCTNRVLVAPVAENLPDLVDELFLHREQMFLDLISALPSPASPADSETDGKRAQARSIIAGQIMSAIIDLWAMQKDLRRLDCSTWTTRQLLARLEKDLTALEKEDQTKRLNDREKQMEEQRHQNARYANYCAALIASAHSRYNNAQSLAVGWLARWSDSAVQLELGLGLKNLYSVDINDLNRANPGVAAEWSAIEEKLKKKFVGSPSSLNAETAKESLADFLGADE